MTTRSKNLSAQRVKALLESYGHNMARFPEDEREAAADLIAQTPELAELAAHTQHLDRLLDASVIQEPSADLMRRVAEVPLRYPRSTHDTSMLGTGLGRLAMIRAALAGFTATAFGAWLGIASLPITEDTSYQEDSVEEFASLMFADDFALDAVDDLSDVTPGDGP